jgi:CRP/FNR family cyclic AMP-dependent transcriptional regulator
MENDMADEQPAPPRALTRRLSDLVEPDADAAARALPQTGILQGLNTKSLENLCHYGRYDRHAAGTVLMSEGKTQDRFYVVVSGELSVTTKKAGKEIALSVAKAGECLGEVSLLEPGPASATVRVAEEAMLWSMDIHDLRVYILDHAGGAGSLLMGMATCLTARLREANELIKKHHMPPAETLPAGRARAITASNTVVQIGFFDKLKKKVGMEDRKTIRISTKIKM